MRSVRASRLIFGKELDMKLLDMLFGRRAADGRDGLRGHADPTGVPAAGTPAKSRTPEEAKARRKAYRKRKAAKAARRRNRR